jgi:tetratricopeptide (TPR) repeat protein
LGQIFGHEKEDSLAIQCYTVALFYKPDYLPSLKSLGIFFYSHSRFDEAILYFKKALELEPNSYEIHNLIGLAIQEKN